MRIQFKYKSYKLHLIEDRDVEVLSLLFDPNPDNGYRPGWFIHGKDYSRGRDGTLFRSFALDNIVIPHRTTKHYTLQLRHDQT